MGRKYRNRTHVSRQPHGDGRPRQRARTRSDLIDAAARLLASGRVPTMTEIAEEALVSRSTAYRYFPDVPSVLRAGIDVDTAPVLERLERVPSDPVARIDALVEGDYEMRRQSEPELRAWLSQSVHRPNGESTVPRGGRVRLIERALEPLRGELDPETYRRLIVALSLVIGTESFVHLKDQWGLEGDEAVEVLRWAARALLNTALGG